MRYLLCQVRNPDDPMRQQEVACFAWGLDCPPDSIHVADLLTEVITTRRLTAYDVVLIGGSGDYSTTQSLPWMERSFDLMRELHAIRKPTFGSCWGFQALAQALGGQVVKDPQQAELGAPEIILTEQGLADPVLGPCGPRFPALIGHEDCVLKLPGDAVSLAGTDLVEHQALCFVGRPIYATQFHPELRRETYLDRVRQYPRYVQQITGLSVTEFTRQLGDPLDRRDILARFRELVRQW